MTKAKSIQEIKDEVAKDYKEKNWHDVAVVLHHHNYSRFIELENEVIKRYASQFQSPIVLPKEDLLEKYSVWLTKHGYMDTDWKDEPPFAIDEFLKTLKQKYL